MLEERLTCLSPTLSYRVWRIEETTRMSSVGYILGWYDINKLQVAIKKRNFPIILIVTKRTNLVGLYIYYLYNLVLAY